MKKCVICGKKILHEYYWNGQVYGKECWKKHCLQEYLEWQKERLEAWSLKCRLLIEVLKMKDMSRIKSQWKQDFVKSVIQQFEEKNRMSRKQYDTAMSLLNNKDMINLYNMMFELELVDEEEYWQKIYNYANVRSKLYKEAEAKVKAYKRAKYIKHWREEVEENENMKNLKKLVHNMLDAVEAGEIEEKDIHDLLCEMRTYGKYYGQENLHPYLQQIVDKFQEAIERWGN